MFKIYELFSSYDNKYLYDRACYALTTINNANFISIHLDLIMFPLYIFVSIQKFLCVLTSTLNIYLSHCFSLFLPMYTFNIKCVSNVIGIFDNSDICYIKIVYMYM